MPTAYNERGHSLTTSRPVPRILEPNPYFQKINTWLLDNKDWAIGIVGRAQFILDWQSMFDAGDPEEIWEAICEYELELKGEG